MAGYKGFGSFHSDNVEELVRLPASEYTPPPLPFTTTAFPASDALVELGAGCRALYRLDLDTFTFVNHGAFGGALRSCLQLAFEWNQYAESQPLRYFDRTLFPHVVHSVRRLASVVNAEPQDIVLVQNATTGLNAVLKSQKFAPGDVVFMLSIAYGSVKKMVDTIASYHPEVTVCRADVDLASLTHPDDVVGFVMGAMPERTKFAVFDHVTSNTALVLPVDKLVAACKARGVECLIDGAHALGSLPLDLSALGAAYYVSNLHKWMSGCKGAALLYVRRDLQPDVHPVVISHGFGAGFLSEFSWDGCRDYTAMLVVPQLLDFWEALGLERCQEYCRNLCVEACAVLTSAWGTETLSPPSFYSHMALVTVPLRVVRRVQAACGSLGTLPPTSDHSKALQDFLYEQNVECPVKCLEGGLHVRISCMVYNTAEDYELLAATVLSFPE